MILMSLLNYLNYDTINPVDQGSAVLFAVSYTGPGL
jgi:hypothetical protein